MSNRTRQARSQIPSWLEKFDDSHGFVWRAYNAVRRINPKRSARFVRAWLKGPTFRRPIFIIGAPRSGTSLLFEMLSRHPGLANLQHEGHDIWRRFHHPRTRNWDSDIIEADRANARSERSFAEAYIRARSTGKSNAERFLEKTPDNTLRVQYILKLFPDAQFVAIHRDPCAVVNSLIDGWRDPDGRFRAYFVPEQLSIPGYPHSRRWCFTLIPGWRDLVSTPIPQIALRQWAEYAKAIARVRAMLPKSQFSEIFLNELRASPAPVIEQLAGEFELELSPTLLNEMCDLTKVNVNSFSDNTETAWRSRNRAEIEALLPEIATLAPCVGYEIDPVTGFAAQMPPFEAPVEASSLAFDNAQRI